MLIIIIIIWMRILVCLKDRVLSYTVVTYSLTQSFLLLLLLSLVVVVVVVVTILRNRRKQKIQHVTTQNQAKPTERIGKPFDCTNATSRDKDWVTCVVRREILDKYWHIEVCIVVHEYQIVW